MMNKKMISSLALLVMIAGIFASSVNIFDGDTSSSGNIIFTTNENFTKNLSIFRYADVDSAYMNLKANKFWSGNFSYHLGQDLGYVLNETTQSNIHELTKNSTVFTIGGSNQSIDSYAIWNLSIPDLDTMPTSIRFSYGRSTHGANSVDYYNHFYIFNYGTQTWDFYNQTLNHTQTNLAYESCNIDIMNRTLNTSYINNGTITLKLNLYNLDTSASSDTRMSGTTCDGYSKSFSGYQTYINFTFGIYDNDSSSVYAQNLSIQINDTSIWNYTGEFNSTDTTIDFSSLLNTILDNGNCSNGTLNGVNCIIPLMFYSDSAGILEYINNLTVTYPYNMTEPLKLKFGASMTSSNTNYERRIYYSNISAEYLEKTSPDRTSVIGDYWTNSSLAFDDDYDTYASNDKEGSLLYCWDATEYLLSEYDINGELSNLSLITRLGGIGAGNTACVSAWNYTSNSWFGLAVYANQIITTTSNLSQTDFYPLINNDYILSHFLPVLDTPTDTIFSEVVLNGSAEDRIQLENATFYIWNLNGSLNDSATVALTGTSNSTSLSFNYPDDKIFIAGFSAFNNNSMEKFYENNITFTVDSISPFIAINSNSDNGSYYSKNNISINFSVTENNFKNATLNLYNETSLVNHIDFTSITESDYSPEYPLTTNSTYICDANITNACSLTDDEDWDTYSEIVGDYYQNFTNISDYMSGSNTNKNIYYKYKGYFKSSTDEGLWCMDNNNEWFKIRDDFAFFATVTFFDRIPSQCLTADILQTKIRHSREMKLYEASLYFLNYTVYPSIDFSNDFTLLIPDNYFYNITSCDLSDKCSTSSTTEINLLEPSISINTPSSLQLITDTDATTPIVITYSTNPIIMDYCYYNITSSSTGSNSVNTTNLTSCENTSTILNVPDTSLSASYEYLLTICGYDNFGNLGCSNQTFFTKRVDSGGVVLGGGGGGGTPPPVIVQLVNWTMLTKSNTEKYYYTISPGETRTDPLIFENLEPTEMEITMMCTGELCNYLTFKETKIDLGISQEIPIENQFTLSIPETFESGNYVLNIVAEDSTGGTQVVTLEISVGGLGGIVFESFNKLGDSFKYSDMKIPYILPYLFTFGIFLVLTYLAVGLKKVPLGLLYSILISFFAGFIPLILI